MNLSFFFDYPFFFLKTGAFCVGVKPFVPLFFIYFLFFLLYLHRFPARGTEAGNGRLRNKGLAKGEKGFIPAYLFLLCLYWFQNVSGGNETFLTGLAENYLRYETLAFFLLAVLRLIWTRCPASLWKPAQMLDRIAQAMVVISVFATIITRQVDSCWLGNALCYFALGALVLTMEYLWRSRCPAAPQLENKDVFRPVETYEQLLPQQRRIADEIISVICGNCAGSSVSICVSGEWGVGKTSVVNGAIDELKRKDKEGGGKRKDAFIYINAMELDTLSSLFDYFFSRIRDILKKRGAYVGLGSEYQKFISSSIGKITDPSIAAFLENRLFPSSDDYRERLDSLEKSIHDTMRGDMILVIVDDVERCEEAKARSFIAFIKEIATMRGVVTVFITDFKYLSAPELPLEQGGAEGAEKGSGFYYDKFFNYRVSIPSIIAEEFMQIKDAEAQRKTTRDRLAIRPTRELFLEFKQKMERMDQEYEEMQAKNEDDTQQPQVNRADRPGNLFGNIFGLPRTLSKLYHSLDQTLELLAGQYLGEHGLDGDTEAYFQNIRLDEVLFFLSCVRACAPNEYSRVMEQGLGYFEHKDTEASIQHRLIIALGDDLLYQRMPLLGTISQTYHQTKAWQFVQLLLQGELPESVKSFSSKEEEWIAEIEQDNVQLMEMHWPDMVSDVTLALAWRDRDRGENCLKKLFSLARDKVENGEWQLKDVFSIFDLQRHNDWPFSQKVPVMELFWENFSGVLDRATRADVRCLNSFATNYCWARADSIMPAICLFVPFDEKRESTYKEIENSLEKYLLGKLPDHKQINALLDSLPVNLELPPAENAYGCLDKLAEKAEALLTERDLYRFDDMKDIVARLRLSAIEFRALEKILKKMDGETAARNQFIQTVDLGEMDRIIEYFQQLSDPDEPGKAERLQRDLGAFFNRLLQSEISLSQEQYQSLQEILTRCTRICGEMASLYRMALAEYWMSGMAGDAPPDR